MHFVIMGSGRVGAAMAIELDRQGHSVAVVDQNPAAFRKLKKDFSGQKVKGVGFDRDTLQRAGIEDAYAFAAVSNGDNSNILSARVARETFGVKRVVARIYDPRRAELYQRLGIATVGPVKWTSRAMLRRMLPDNSEVIFADRHGDLAGSPRQDVAHPAPSGARKSVGGTSRICFTPGKCPFSTPGLCGAGKR